MIKVTQKGSFKNSEAYLSRLKTTDFSNVLNRYGVLGVTALSNATPVESGLTAESWTYSIKQRQGYFSIRWHNTHHEDGVPIAVILQYGHGTGTGGYVQGRNYIMPAIQPIFDQILADAIKEVTRI